MKIEIDDTVLIDTFVEKVVEKNKKSPISNGKDRLLLLMSHRNSFPAKAGILRRKRVS
jgi:hypothetical protein